MSNRSLKISTALSLPPDAVTSSAVIEGKGELRASATLFEGA